MLRRCRKCFHSAQVQFTSNEHLVRIQVFGFVMLCHWFKQSKTNYPWTAWPVQMKTLCSIEMWEPLTEQHCITSKKTWIFNSTSWKPQSRRHIVHCILKFCLWNWRTYVLNTFCQTIFFVRITTVQLIILCGPEVKIFGFGSGQWRGRSPLLFILSP
jgi:hypothetical protein